MRRQLRDGMQQESSKGPPTAGQPKGQAAALSSGGTALDKKVTSLLERELHIVEALMYRNKSQHRTAMYFKKLQEVRRNVRELEPAHFAGFLLQARQTLVQPAASARAEDKDAAALRLQTMGSALGAAVEQCCATCESCESCATLLTREVSRKFFLNIMVFLLAAIARMDAIARHLGRAAFELYAAVQDKLPPDSRDARYNHVRRRAEEALLVPREDTKVVTGVVEQGVARKAEGDGQGVAGDGREEDTDLDDLGVSLGQQQSVGPAVASYGAAGPRSIAPTHGATGSRALLATEYSSSEEDDDKPKAPVTFVIDRGGTELELEEVTFVPESKQRQKRGAAHQADVTVTEEGQLNGRVESKVSEPPRAEEGEDKVVDAARAPDFFSAVPGRSRVRKEGPKDAQGGGSGPVLNTKKMKKKQRHKLQQQQQQQEQRQPEQAQEKETSTELATYGAATAQDHGELQDEQPQQAKRGQKVVKPVVTPTAPPLAASAASTSVLSAALNNLDASRKRSSVTLASLLAGDGGKRVAPGSVNRKVPSKVQKVVKHQTKEKAAASGGAGVSGKKRPLTSSSLPSPSLLDDIDRIFSTQRGKKKKKGSS